MRATALSHLPRNQVLAWLIWTITPVVVLSIGFGLSFGLPLQALSSLVIWAPLTAVLALSTLVGFFFWMLGSRDPSPSQPNNLMLFGLSSATSIVSWILFALILTGSLSLTGLPFGMGVLIHGALFFLGIEMALVGLNAIFNWTISKKSAAAALATSQEDASLMPAGGLRERSPVSAEASPTGASDRKTSSPLSPSALASLARRAVAPRTQRPGRVPDLASLSADTLPVPPRPPTVDLRKLTRALTDQEREDLQNLPLNKEEQEFLRLIKAKEEDKAIEHFKREKWKNFTLRLEFRDENGYTPRFLAGVNGLCRLDKKLAGYGVYYAGFRYTEPTIWLTEGDFALMDRVIQNKDPDALKFMLSKGWFPWAREYNGLNITSYIASLGFKHLKMLEVLINRNKGDVNDGDDSGSITPLIAAARAGHEEVVVYLLAQGANSAYKTKAGETAFGEADRKGHTKVMTQLEAHQREQEHVSPRP